MLVGSMEERTPQRLPVALLWSTIELGRGVVHGLSEHGEPHSVDLRTYRLLPPRFSPPIEASSARWEHWLAGPRGVVWDLRTGLRCFRAPALALGLTVGTPHGFVTMDWDTHEGWFVDPQSGRQSHRFVLPADPGDTVARGIWRDGAVWVQTVLGAGFRVDLGSVDAVQVTMPPSRPPDPIAPISELPLEGTADVGRHRFGWTEDGWLFAFPYKSIS